MAAQLEGEGGGDISPLRDPHEQVDDTNQNDTDTVTPIQVQIPTQPKEHEKKEREPRKRPKLDLKGLVGGRERKRGVLGVLLGTLNKAKLEDKERNATEAAKKRNMIDQRLQSRIAKEHESVRRAEEVKRERMLANRKEEELALRDSIFKNRQSRLAHLSHFLNTSDDIMASISDEPDLGDGMDDDKSQKEGDEKEKEEKKKDPLAALVPPRAHPPHIYYLPNVLLPSQISFIERRKNEVSTALSAEHTAYITQRKTTLDEIRAMRARVESAVAETQPKDEEEKMQEDSDVEVEVEAPSERQRERTETPPPPVKKDAGDAMDEDDAVEY